MAPGFQTIGFVPVPISLAEASDTQKGSLFLWLGSRGHKSLASAPGLQFGRKSANESLINNSRPGMGFAEMAKSDRVRSEPLKHCLDR